MRVLVLLVALAVMPAAAEASWTGGTSQPDDLAIHLVTLTPDHLDSAAWFGHTALLVEDLATNETWYYAYYILVDYGPGRVLATTGGSSTFRLGNWTWESILSYAEEADREVRTVELPLPPAARFSLAQRLARESGPAGPVLDYHLFKDNCSTRVRDMIDEFLGGALRAGSEAPTGETVRSLMAPHLDHRLAVLAGANLLGNGQIDQPLSLWESYFLPADLERGVARLAGEPVVVATTDVVDPEAGAWVRGWWLGGLVLGAAMLATVRLPRRAVALVHVAVNLALCPVAAALLATWLLPSASPISQNAGVLAISPLALAAAACSAWWFWSPRAARTLVTLYAVALAAIGLGLMLRFGGAMGQRLEFVLVASAALHAGLLAGALSANRDPVAEDQANEASGEEGTSPG